MHCTCPCTHGAVLSCNWVAGCLCLCSLPSLSYCVTSHLCANQRQCFKIGTEHKCGSSVRQILAARWIGKRRYQHTRMRRRKKTSFGRKRFWFIADTSLVLVVVSWKITLLGIRVGDAAVPGPATATHMRPNEKNHNFWETRGGGRASLSEAHSDIPISMLQHIQQLSTEQAYRHANETLRCHFTNGGGRGSPSTAHSDVPLSILHHAAVDEASDEPGVGLERLSDSGVVVALPSDPHAASQTQSSNTISLNSEVVQEQV